MGDKDKKDGKEEMRTLWVGDIETWMDENYIVKLFQTTADVSTVKIIRDKSTNSERYEFKASNSLYGMLSNKRIIKHVLNTAVCRIWICGVLQPSISKASIGYA